MMNIDEAIAHAKEVAQEKYNEGFLCHANPNDDKLDDCIECAKEHEQLAEWLTELKKYKQLEKQGLLLKLPCKVGDTLWTYANYPAKYVYPFQISDIQLTEKTMSTTTIGTIKWSDIGQTVFLAKAEADEALKKMKSGE